MLVGPSPLRALGAANGGNLLFQEEVQETASAQVPSTPPRPAARDRDAAVPPWAWLLLIPIAIALAALVLFRRRGYNPNHRLDLRKQPEGARYRERLPVAAAVVNETEISEGTATAEADFASLDALEDLDEELDERGRDEAESLPERQAAELHDEVMEDSDVSFEDDDDSWLEEDAPLLDDEEGEFEEESPAFSPSLAAPAGGSSLKQAPPFESTREAAAEAGAMASVAIENEELLRLRTESQVLQEELASVRRALERAEAGHVDALAAADEKLHLLQSEVETARSASQDAIGEVDTLKTRLSQLRESNEALSAELAANRDELKQLREGAIRAEQRIADARSENEELRQKIAAMEKELRDGERDRQSLVEQMGGLKTAHEEAESRYQEIRERLDATTSRWKEMQQTADGMTATELLDKLNEKRKLLHLVQEKLREKLALIEEMKQEKSGRRSGKG